MKDDNGDGVIRMDLKPDQRICNKCHCQVGLSKDKKLKLEVEIFQYILHSVLHLVRLFTHFVHQIVIEVHKQFDIQNA